MKNQIETKNPLTSITIGGATAALIVYLASRAGVPMEEQSAQDLVQHLFAVGSYVVTLVGRFRANKRVQL